MWNVSNLPKHLQPDANVEISRRNSICLDCRTALDEGEPCDGGRFHRTTSLTTAEGRQQLLFEVWGPPHLRQRAKQVAKASGTGAAGGALLETCGLGVECADCAGVAGLAEAGSVIIFIAATAAATGILFWSITKLIDVIRRHRNRLRPRGALRKPAVKAGTLVVGTVSDIHRPALGANGESAAAYGLSLRCKRSTGSDRMLIDGHCGQLEISLDDGRTLHLTPQRVRLETRPAQSSRWIDVKVDRYLQQLDPRYDKGGGTSDPFPYDQARQALLHLGDRVEVRGELSTMVDPTGAEGGYRDAAPTRLETRGAPVLRILTS